MSLCRVRRRHVDDSEDMHVKTRIARQREVPKLPRLAEAALDADILYKSNPSLRAFYHYSILERYLSLGGRGHIHEANVQIDLSRVVLSTILCPGRHPLQRAVCPTPQWRKNDIINSDFSRRRLKTRQIHRSNEMGILFLQTTAHSTSNAITYTHWFRPLPAPSVLLR
jgi:hypothetical protein